MAATTAASAIFLNMRSSIRLWSTNVATDAAFLDACHPGYGLFK
jgi:hypothetical protein